MVHVSEWNYEVHASRTCRECDGFGKITDATDPKDIYTFDCKYCGGSGIERKTMTLEQAMRDEHIFLDLHGAVEILIREVGEIRRKIGLE